MNSKTSPEDVSTGLSSRKQTFYHVQRVEIVTQLKARKEWLEGLLTNGAVPALESISTTLRTKPNVAWQAYMLNIRPVEVMFEWHGPAGPFQDPASMDESLHTVNMRKWMKQLKKGAQDLGVGAGKPPGASAGSTGAGGGATQTRDQESANQSQHMGENILKRVNAESGQLHSQADATDASTMAADPWDSVGPTADDIKASKQGFLQRFTGWLALMKEWLITLFTAPMRRVRQPEQSTASERDGHAPQQQDAEAAARRSALWSYVDERLDAIAKEQPTVSAGLVDHYLGTSIQNFVSKVDELGLAPNQSEFEQADADIRTDGTTKHNLGRGEAMDKAKQEAADQVHFRDDAFAKADMYMILKASEALKDMATKRQLEGFDDKFLKYLGSISRYNELVQAGKVDEATAERINAALKSVWQNVLRFALDHGEKIEDLRTALDNYHIVKDDVGLLDQTKRVVNKVTETAKKVVEVVKKVAEAVWSGVGWLWKRVTKFVPKLVKIVQEIPVVREVVTFVKEKIVNPVYSAAAKFFQNAWERFKESATWKAVATPLTVLTQFVTTNLLPLLKRCWGLYLTLALCLASPAFFAVAKFAFLAALTVAWATFLYKRLRFWWQGAGEMSENWTWGSEFDILDGRNGSRVTRYRMRLRQALRRVWASSWLQWMLDGSRVRPGPA